MDPTENEAAIVSQNHVIPIMQGIVCLGDGGQNDEE
jgi:hypothetical protein